MRKISLVGAIALMLAGVAAWATSTNQARLDAPRQDDREVYDLLHAQQENSPSSLNTAPSNSSKPKILIAVVHVEFV